MPYVDILTHILPAVDDGPESMAEGVQMALAAARQGTRTIVATPHQRDVLLNSSMDDVRSVAADLNSRLRRESPSGARVRVLLGMENHLSPDLPEQVDAGQALTLNASRFILIALPFTTFPDYITDILARLRLKRLVPVLARPERNETLRRDVKKMAALVEEGTLFVASAGSITGEFGKEAQRAALRLTGRGLVHAVVSDMHRHEGSRSPGMRRAFRWIERASGPETATRLFEVQPQMILGGHSPMAEPVGSDLEPSSWWLSRLAGFARNPRRGGP